MPTLTEPTPTRPFTVEVARAGAQVTVGLVGLGPLGRIAGWVTCRGAVLAVGDRVPDAGLFVWRLLAAELGADPPPARVTVAGPTEPAGRERLRRIRDLYAALADALNDEHERLHRAPASRAALDRAAGALYRDLLGAPVAA